MKILLTYMLAFVFSILSFHTATAGSIAGNDLKLMEYTYDFAKDGGALGTIDLSKKLALPVDAMILRGGYVVKTAFTSSGAATVAIGDAASTGRYLTATGYSNPAYAANTPAIFAQGVPMYIDVANAGKMAVTISGAALTAGKMKVWAEVYQPSAK